jgi:transposase InsO family protein
MLIGQMVLCDGKFFRAGRKRAKRRCYFFLDDATRYALYAIVGYNECSELFLRGLFELICRHGLVSAFYLDKGPGFIAKDAHRVCACLNIPIILGRTRYPQGHGKIERFNDTAFQRALRSLARPDVDPSPQALTLRLNHFLEKEYNESFHEGIKTTPKERFEGDSRPLTYPLSEDDLRRHFVLDAKRKVRPDNVVKINDVLYEVPLGYSGRRIMVYRDLVEARISMFHEGRLITLKPADLAANARERRRVKRKKKEEQGEIPIRTAADISFDEDFGPITDPYGGFQQPED